MIIKPVVSDSLGVRSLSVFIETDDARIFIDPSAALGPYRYGLPPKPPEIQALEFYKKRIRELAVNADIIIISHYHYDHYDPREEFYDGKLLILKDPVKKINYSQKKRARDFLNYIGKRAKIEYGDGKVFEFGGTKIKISEPFPHGDAGTRLGYVVMTTVEDENTKFLHASDVGGPVYDRAAEYIISENPDIAVIDGPATYFLGYRFSHENLVKSIKNLMKIGANIEKIILDHHLLRDLKYRERLEKVYSSGNFLTFAEYLGEKINMLEAHRKEL